MSASAKKARAGSASAKKQKAKPTPKKGKSEPLPAAKRRDIKALAKKEAPKKKEFEKIIRTLREKGSSKKESVK